MVKDINLYALVEHHAHITCYAWRLFKYEFDKLSFKSPMTMMFEIDGKHDQKCFVIAFIIGDRCMQCYIT